jgi:hypothetical protein
MSRRRRILLSAAVLIASACLALGVLAMLPPRPSVMKANFDRIEVGMTGAEVHAVLGDPHQLFGPEGPATWGHWRHSDGSSITINFSGTKVVRKQFHSSTETIPDKLRRWLHLP